MWLVAQFRSSLSSVGREVCLYRIAGSKDAKSSEVGDLNECGCEKKKKKKKKRERDKYGGSDT